jgi:hypothetical protein
MDDRGERRKTRTEYPLWELVVSHLRGARDVSPENEHNGSIGTRGPFAFFLQVDEPQSAGYLAVIRNSVLLGERGGWQR